ncbi:MAG: hypothetical protein QM803_01625 [Rhodocyclaceae bacterium]
MKKLAAAAILAVLGSGLAQAADHGVYAGISTLGVGVGYKYSFNDKLGMRLGYNGGSLNATVTEDGVDYDGKAKMNSVELLADYHPFGNGFALSAGILYNRSKFTGDSAAGTNSITINGKTYTGTNPSAHYDARLDDDKWSPYLGIGWTSNPAGVAGWAFNARLGVLFQNPKGTVTTSGINDTTGTLEKSRAQAEQTLNDDLDKVKIYPVLGIGVSYAF